MLKRFNAFVYGDKKELPKPIENLNEKVEETKIEEPTKSEILSVKEELCEKYLYTDENNGVMGITIENDEQGEYIQFNIECETELTSVDEYKGHRLIFNRLCEIKTEEELPEEKIIEDYKKLNEKLMNDFRNEL